MIEFFIIFMIAILMMLFFGFFLLIRPPFDDWIEPIGCLFSIVLIVFLSAFVSLLLKHQVIFWESYIFFIAGCIGILIGLALGKLVAWYEDKMHELRGELLVSMSVSMLILGIIIILPSVFKLIWSILVFTGRLLATMA